MKTVRTIGAMAGLLLPLTILGLSGVAEAQTTGQYPPRARVLAVDRSSTPAGGTVVVSGQGTPNGRVDFTLVLGTTISRSVALGSATTDAGGFYRATLTIPCETPQGDHTLRASGAANDSTRLNISGTAQVCPSGGATTAGVATGGALPRTGSSSTAPLAAAGAGLVLIGAATAITARRRRSAESA